MFLGPNKELSLVIDKLGSGIVVDGRCNTKEEELVYLFQFTYPSDRQAELYLENERPIPRNFSLDNYGRLIVRRVNNLDK